MTDRTLDYVARLDERNRAYRLTAPDPGLLQKSRYWVPGSVVLDQGQEGACVGFGCTGEAMASPVRVKFASDPNGVAQSLYKLAQKLDSWAGEDYEGTSVLAGMKAGQSSRWWTGYKWAFNMTELRAALEEGPVVIGVDWYGGMYDPVGDWLQPEGDVAGGHCILVTGYQASTKSYRLRNSWGADWGRNGSAYIKTDDLDKILFQAGGEAAVVQGRAL